jgi:hypothetical protein
MPDLFRRLEQFPGLGDIFMSHLINENKDCLRGFACLLANGAGDSLADIFLLSLCECAGNPDTDVWHDVLSEK